MRFEPFAGHGLRPVELADQDAFRPYFSALLDPLSDYTFSQIYTWRNSLHLVWKILAGHLCVFANGTGDLTLLLPPIGETNSDAALREAFELMDDYNAAQGVPERSRVEYASEELLARFDRSKINAVPMGTDYVYDTARMIDLAGGDLASKRQAKNRFLRLYQSRVEFYDPAKHLDGCLALLENWRTHQDAAHLEEANTNSIKRQKETIATELALRSAGDLGLKGMVVYAQGPTDNSASREPSGSAAGSSPENAKSSPEKMGSSDEDSTIRGFTFGELLGSNQSSIVIEKTDLEIKGLAQFIFSEFCRQEWSHRPLCNVGDDWGLESLGWTKMSYRPVKLLQKYAMKKAAVSRMAVPAMPGDVGTEKNEIAKSSAPRHGRDARATFIRAASRDDLTATVDLEKACFSSDLSLKKRQLQYLQQRSSAVFLVAEQDDQIVGEGIALVRQHRRGLSGRIYSLAVNETHRGQKIGQRLLQRMLEELSTRGVKRVYLEVEKSNAGAVALYERSGFRSIGVLPAYYGAGKDGVHMMADIPVAAGLFDAAVVSGNAER